VGRIAALAVVAAAVAAMSGRARAGDLDPAVPNVPARLPDPFAVMLFENRSGVQSLGWMSAGAAFLVGEKAEAVAALRPVYGPYVAPAGTPVAVNAGSVAAFAGKTGARWVFAGWVARPNWELQVGISLWKVEGGVASQVGEVVRRGEFGKLPDFAGEAIGALCEKAGVALGADDRTHLARRPTGDFYAYTLFGRGLSAALGTEGAPDLEKAGKNVQRSVFVDPKLTEGQRVLAEILRAQGKDKKAKGRLGYALSLRPDYYPAIVALGRLAQGDRKLDQARELYEQALRLRAWDLESRFQLGKTLWEQGDVDGAFREMSRVVKHRPKDIRARRVLVMIHASRGDNADLVKELQAVADLDPADETTRMDLAAAYASLGKLDLAIKAYEGIIEKNPKQVSAMKFLGDLHKRQGDMSGAIRYYGMALKAEPNDPRPYFLLGAIYMDSGRQKDAKRIYQRAQRFKRYLPETFNNLGAIAYREGNLGESMWYHRRAVMWKPSSARYRYNYALSLSASKYVDAALAQVDRALKIEPNHVELHYLRGVILVRKGRADEARLEFEKTLALDAKHEAARHNLDLLDQLKRRAEEGEVVIEGRK
jgi:Flp pilus assembly protein TadD